MTAPQVARRLKVTRKSACAWLRAYKAGGKAAPASRSAVPAVAGAVAATGGGVGARPGRARPA
ncbi:hypothetical protein [Streptosporangium amethystogenes]|uniref:hypothetical protein n=1 Tax=Streptosporangium amethystogenes TaxID=2002 RepID=UPI003CCB7506